MTEYATAITFPQTGTTYEAFSKLSAAADQYGVRSGDRPTRRSGAAEVPESGDMPAPESPAGSLIGMLVGVLGGRVGRCSGGVSAPDRRPVRRGPPGHG